MAKKKNVDPEAKFEVQTEIKTLRYDFTASETHDHALLLAQKIAQRNAEEDEKKAVAKKHASSIESLGNEINQLSEKITAGWENRDIECEVYYNTPTDGIKTYVRKDTGTRFTSQMEDYEWNLFNQNVTAPKDDEELTDAEVIEEGPKLLGTNTSAVDDF